jgi:gamma-D-glutamyl-L-lysine dipeptidyl-peptidase
MGMVILLLAMAFLAAGNTAVVSWPVANMYSQPSEDAGVVSQAIYGSGVGILEERPGWARVRTSDDYEGWMPLEALKRGAAYPAGRAAEVDSLFAHLYSEPDVTRRKPLLTVPFETRLEMAGDPGPRWLEVRLVDGRTGWAQVGDVVIDPQPLPISAALTFAQRFLGLPYTWGGTSTFGYDCSGFTQMLLRRRGIRIPRDAGPQARWSGFTAVDKSALAPGDMLYFGKTPEKIDHTGMDLGEGRFIHATTHEHPAEQISALADPYWTGLLVACRRPR